MTRQPGPRVVVAGHAALCFNSRVLSTVPVIDVTTTGVNWPSIVTGIVGVVGIGATFIQSKSARKAATADLRKSLDAAADKLRDSLRADDSRVLRSEKLRVYSQFHGTVDDVIVLGVVQKEERTSAAQVNDALTAMYKSTAAVRLIATISVGNLANDTAKAAVAEVGSARMGTHEFDRDNAIYSLRQQLYAEMRADLGIQQTGN